MPAITWLGDQDPQAQRITHGGYSFVKGEAVTVKDKDAWKFAGNPTFSTEKDAEPVEAIEPPSPDPEEGSEKAELKRLLREAGEDVRGNPSLETLRGKLAKITAPAS